MEATKVIGDPASNLLLKDTA